MKTKYNQTKKTQSNFYLKTMNNFKVNTDNLINNNNINNNNNDNNNITTNKHYKTNYNSFSNFKKRMPLYFNLSLDNEKLFPKIDEKFNYNNTYNNNTNKNKNKNSIYQKYRIVTTEGDYKSVNNLLYSKFKLSFNPINETRIYLLKGKNKFKKKNNNNNNSKSLSLRIGVNYPFDLEIPPKIMSIENQKQKKLTLNFLEYITKKNAFKEKIQKQLDFNDFGFRLKSQRRRNYNPLNV